ncbi:hypothetical protein Bca52824_090238 [Brassica carinata]|uniref:Endonuclease/exonuclease/phosphatase domain-containing protein n=1 Tax=Brassica carinata TaxID=52824 RepID=A0A8X7TGW8_BRACI|nr:hypothetical protein Bca52824_090238 [Brassica carinata]
MDKLCRGWNFTSNHSEDAEGRIIIIWRDSVSVRVLHKSSQSVTCEVKIPGASQFVYTAVYAANDGVTRTDLWVELLQISQAFSLDSAPWILGGDFNQIIHPAEHSLADVNHLSSDMVELKDCLTQLGLYDLRYQGPLFTWSNHQPEGPIAKKLDRLLINSLVLSLFPNASAFFHPPLISDHTPCILDLAFKIPSAGNRPFKFYNYLTKHPDFLLVVQNAWAQAGSMVWNLTGLCWKQKQIKGELKILNRENFSQIQKRVSEANRLLTDLQVQALHSPSPQLFEQEKNALQTWRFLRDIEESYYKQRSRVNWLKVGDQNTTFFYRMVQTRLSFNLIRSFVLPTGVIIEDATQMSIHAVSHFKSILGPTPVPAPVTFSSTGWMGDYINSIVLVLSMGSSVRLEPLYLGFALCGTGVGFPDITSSLGYLF